MKKPSKLGLIVILMVLASALITFVLAFTYSGVYDLNHKDVLGKTKVQVLEYAFANSPRVNDGDVNIVVQNANGDFVNKYYKSIESAKSDTSLMQADKWNICYKDEYILHIVHKTYYIEVLFRDGVVSEAKISWQADI